MEALWILIHSRGRRFSSLNSMDNSMLRFFRNIRKIQKETMKSWYPRRSAIQKVNDIIKAHGGFLEVSTKQNEGTFLTIKLSEGV